MGVNVSVELDKERGVWNCILEVEEIENTQVFTAHDPGSCLSLAALELYRMEFGKVELRDGPDQVLQQLEEAIDRLTFIGGQLKSDDSPNAALKQMLDCAKRINHKHLDWSRSELKSFIAHLKLVILNSEADS